MTSDGELLRRYAEAASEGAFGELVRRHLDLVYSAALRQVNGDTHLAQDVAQTVFADLARKAASLAGRPALTGWLYTSAHYAAAKMARTEQRRHIREQEAHAMQDLLHDPRPNLDWETLRPVLDTAMHELSESDREVILLRYFEKRPHAEIGGQIGLSENAARMRVERALEKLRTVLSRRGVTGTVALSAALSANAVTVAPVGLAATITTASVLAGTTIVTTATATATKAIVMTTLQKTLAAATIAAAIGTGVYQGHQNSKLREQCQTLQQQQSPLQDQIAQLRQERDKAASKLDAARQENEDLRQSTAELPKLRGELARLRAAQSGQSNTAGLDPNDPSLERFREFRLKAAKIAQCLEKMPDKNIPELHFLTDEDWLIAAKAAKFDTEADVRKTLSRLRSLAKNKMPMGWALNGFIHAHNGQLPTDLSQLKPYFKTPVDDGSPSHWQGVDPERDDAILDAILARYELLHTGNVSDYDAAAWFVAEKSSVDKDYDTRGKFGNSTSTLISTGIGAAGDPDDKSY